MTDYISREEALDALAPFCKDCRFADDEENCAQCPHGYIRLKLNTIPAADVRPAVHGEWVYEEPNGANNFKGCYWCDQCHQPINHKKNFCPNCGADMREGTK